MLDKEKNGMYVTPSTMVLFKGGLLTKNEDARSPNLRI